MKLDVGKYRGSEISELSSEYLEWALGHLSLTDEAARAVQAEHARRRNQAHQSSQTPLTRALSRAGRPASRLTARLHSRFLAWLHRG